MGGLYEDGGITSRPYWLQLRAEQPAARARTGPTPQARERAIAEDRCESVILGCAGMADLTVWLSAETGVPVIDGVVAGVKMIEALIGAGITTSKVGAYASPREK